MGRTFSEQKGYNVPNSLFPQFDPSKTSQTLACLKFTQWRPQTDSSSIGGSYCTLSKPFIVSFPGNFQRFISVQEIPSILYSFQTKFKPILSSCLLSSLTCYWIRSTLCHVQCSNLAQSVLSAILILAINFVSSLQRAIHYFGMVYKSHLF